MQAATDPKATRRQGRTKGDWKITSAKQGGKDADDQIVGQPVTIDGEKIKFRHEATYTIDATQKPKTIDLEIKDGPGTGTRNVERRV